MSTDRKKMVLGRFDADNAVEKWINDRLEEGYVLESLTSSSILVYNPDRRRSEADHAIWVAMRYQGDPKVQKVAQRLREARLGGYE